MTKEISIILIDSKSDLEIIEKTTDEKIIITFDYDSHIKLLDKKINHEISDNYLDNNDLIEIEKKLQLFSFWFKEKSIQDILNYNGVNLGQLFYPELHNLLVPFLKKFFEIKNIYLKYKEANFLASSNLNEFLKVFSNTIKKSSDGIKSIEFLYDSHKIPIKIGKNNYSVDISRSNFHRFKNIFEKIIHQLFGPTKEKCKKNSILLIECDTIRYRKIFENLPKFQLNLMLFNRRRPVIWNKTSFSIIQKSKCSILTRKIIKNDYHKDVENGIIQISKKIKLLKNQSFFKNYFFIENFSFWELLKPVFFELTEKRMKDAIEEIEITKHVFETCNFKAIVIWSEHGFNEQIVVQLAKKYNIKIILVQHGIYHDSKDSFDMNKFKGVLPIYSELFFVWGNLTKNYALDYGIAKNRIIEIGSPIHDLTWEMKKGIESKNILLALPPITENIIDDLKIETIDNYKSSIKKIYQICKKNNKKLIIKDHPAPSKINLDEYIKKIDPDIVLIKSGNIAEFIKKCSVLITIDISTSMLDAQIFNKPIISILIKDVPQNESQIIKSNSFVEMKNIDDLDHVLLRLLSDNENRKKQIIGQQDFLKKYLVNLGTASDKFLTQLESIQHT